MNLSLNCYAYFSTYLAPGYSLESPEGQKLYQEALAKYRKAHAGEAAADDCRVPLSRTTAGHQHLHSFSRLSMELTGGRAPTYRQR